jgi:hypothetical protein
MITIPMLLAFDQYPTLFASNFTVDVIFFVDILLSLNTAYFSDNDEVYIYIYLYIDKFNCLFFFFFYIYFRFILV